MKFIRKKANYAFIKLENANSIDNIHLIIPYLKYKEKNYELQ